jgi:hypothetical protein
MAVVESLPLIPAWRGDETLYSWAGWFHRTLGGGSPRETGTALFGVAHAYKDYGAPTKIQCFCNATGGLLGDARSVLLKRTVLGAYYPFLRADQRAMFDVLLQSPKPTSWLTRFGMRASALDSTKLLRWCPECAVDDIDRWRLARWRVPHQLPGAWWCIDHGCLLMTHEPQHATWTAPPTNERPDPHGRKLAQKHAAALHAMASLALGLVGTSSVDVPMLKRAVLSSLREQGVISNGKPLGAPALRRWFIDTPSYQALIQVDTPLANRLDSDWIYEALLKRRVGHPLLWVILWTAAHAGHLVPDLIHGFHHPERMLSWNDDGQGMLWIEADLRGDATVQQIVLNASSVREAAEQLLVSPTAVRRYLRDAQCNSTLLRAQCHRDVREAKAIEEIKGLMQSVPTTTRADVHRDCKGAVNWLRRWNPGLLDELLALVPEVRARQQVLFG